MGTHTLPEAIVSIGLADEPALPPAQAIHEEQQQLSKASGGYCSVPFGDTSNQA